MPEFKDIRDIPWLWKNREEGFFCGEKILADGYFVIGPAYKFTSRFYQPQAVVLREGYFAIWQQLMDIVMVENGLPIIGFVEQKAKPGV